jgi:hypothetical protein
MVVPALGDCEFTKEGWVVVPVKTGIRCAALMSAAAAALGSPKTSGTVVVAVAPG